MRNFKYYDNNDLTYVFTGLKLINELVDSKFLQKLTIKKLEEIHKTVVNHIKKRPEKMDKTSKGRYELLKNIIFKIEDISLKIMYLPISSYDKNKLEFIYYLIFDYKNFDLVKNAIEKYPHLVNLRENGKSLIEYVVENYLMCLKNYLDNYLEDDLPLLTYYKEILKLIINSEKFSFSSQDKKDCLKLARDFIKNNTYHEKNRKEKYYYYTNFLTMSLNGYSTDEFENLEYEFDIQEEFNPSVQSEAYKIHINFAENFFSNDFKIVSFDKEGTIEIDDALSVRKDGGIIIFGVHIADPTKKIKLGSIIDDEASRRCRSIYTDEECIYMYPKILSTDKLSLIAGNVRNAVNYYFYFDMSKFSLIDFRVTDDNIMVSDNSTYEAFDQAFYNGTGDKDFVSLVYNLAQISPLLEKTINKDSIYMEVNNCSGAISQRVIANSMVYTGINVAKFFFENNLPFIFRNHKLTDEKLDRLKELRGKLVTLNEDKINYSKILLSEYPKAYYSSICEGHAGLGVPYYGTVTSPLRKDSDSNNVRVVKKFMIDTYTEKDIEMYDMLTRKVSKNINARDDYIRKYEQLMINKLSTRGK